MRPKSNILIAILSVPLLLFTYKISNGQQITPEDADVYASPVPGEKAIGRWDITLNYKNTKRPTWLEIYKSGGKTFVGKFVGMGGSERPITQIHYNTNTEEYSFSIPAQWGNDQVASTFSLDNGELKGIFKIAKEQIESSWVGKRAPKLDEKVGKQMSWGQPIDLLQNGLSDWKFTRGWEINNGVLAIKAKGTEQDRNKGGNQNIRTKEKFKDFKLHVEFRYGKGANSGIYLRGRYEVQILDSYGMEAESHILGGIYGFLSPIKNYAKKPEEWQSLDVTLIGRYVTVVLNGQQIICNRPIPGITGGALDANEGEPGPIMIQGDHYGLLEYRNMSITPAK